MLNTLPKRFVLLPAHDGVLEVNVSAQCVGYVWTDDNKWLAKDREGQSLGVSVSLFEAVHAVFKTCSTTIS
jgi:uncharacterized membrane-anchored protein YjiN (DUF445 family)